MAANLTNYGAQQALDYFLTTNALVRPTTVYMALHTANPTPVGNVAEIGAGLGYARQLCTIGSANLVARVSTNSAILTFGPAIGAGFTVAYMSLWDAVAGGNTWWYGSITGKAVAANDSYAVPVGFLTLTFPAINP